MSHQRLTDKESATRQTFGYIPGVTREQYDKFVYGDSSYSTPEEVKKRELGYIPSTAVTKIMPVTSGSLNYGITVGSVTVVVGSKTKTFTTQNQKKTEVEKDPYQKKFLIDIGVSQKREVFGFKSVVQWDTGFNGGIAVEQSEFDYFFDGQTKNVVRCGHRWTGADQGGVGIMCRAKITKIEDIDVDLDTTLLGLNSIHMKENNAVLLGTFYLLNWMPYLSLPRTSNEVTVSNDDFEDRIAPGTLKILPFNNTTFDERRSLFLDTEEGKQVKSDVWRYHAMSTAFCKKYTLKNKSQPPVIPLNSMQCAVGAANQTMVMARFVSKDIEEEYMLIYVASSVFVRGDFNQRIVALSALLDLQERYADLKQEYRKKVDDRVVELDEDLKEVGM